MVVSQRLPWPAPLAAVAVALACSSAIPERSVVVDCGTDDGYEYLTMQSMERVPPLTMPQAGSWFGFGDATPGGVNLVELREIPGGRCDSTDALVVTVNGRTDWGAGFGEYATSQAPMNASEYEGVSFWARATGYGTSTGFLLTIHDRNTFAEEVDPDAPEPPAANRPVCTVPDAEDTVEAYVVNEAGVLVPVGGDLPGPNDCGNGFVRVVTAQRNWHLHRLPFESFQQQALPNRKPGGIDTSALFQFAINIPKDSNIELWLDDLGLYRRQQPTEPTQADTAAQ
jgi:hypothetical protein